MRLLGLNNLALTYKLSGNMEKAVVSYEEALELDRKAADANPLDLSASAYNETEWLCFTLFKLLEVI